MVASKIRCGLLLDISREARSRDGAAWPRAQPEWKAEQWGLPVNQIDMVATYLGFCVIMLEGLRLMGIPVTARNSKAVMHLWAYAGWLMGVDERWLVHRERDGVVLFRDAPTTQSRPIGPAVSLGAHSRASRSHGATKTSRACERSSPTTDT